MLFKSPKGRSDQDGVRALWASTGLEEVDYREVAGSSWGGESETLP